MATVPERDRPVAQRRGEGERERQVQAGLGDGEAAGEVGVDVVEPRADAGPPAEDRDSRPSRFGSSPLALRAACRSRPARPAPGPRRARPAALQRRGDDAARARRSACSARNARAGSRDLEQPAVGHLEDADLLGRAEPVLRRADQAQGRVALALEGDDGVDEVLQRLGPGDRRRPWSRGRRGRPRCRRPWRSSISRTRRLADLADAAGGAVELVDRRGLDRVDDDERRARSRRATSTIRPTSCSARTWTSRRRPARRAGRGGRPGGGPGPPIPRRSRTGPAPAAMPGRGLEQERRLADARLAAEQDERARARARRRGRGRARRCRSASAGASASPMSARATGVGRAGTDRGRAAARARRSRTTVSTRVFQPPQARHWPSQRRKASPQDWQT